MAESAGIGHSRPGFLVGIWVLVLGHCLLASAALAQTGAVNGFVRDSTDGEPLAYCNVYLDKTEFGAATNDKGYFYIGRVPPGRYDLVASFVGYKDARRALAVGAYQTVNANLELSHGSIAVKEVTVTADRERFEREVEVSAVRLDTKQLQFVPKVGGEADLFRTIQLLPGVVSTSDFSNRLYIRGGSPDQNLILLDGITVYNPSHLFGLFSPFIEDAVSDATLLAGGFPAKYGGRLSSVLDVTTKEGDSKQFSGDASVSMIAAQGLVQGPIPGPRSEARSADVPSPQSFPQGGEGKSKGDSASVAKDKGLRTKDVSSGKDEGQRTKDEGRSAGDTTVAGFQPSGSYLIAGRRTYLPDILLKAFGVDGLGYYFYDLIGKANYEPWKDSRFTLTGLASEDVLDFWDPSNANGLKANLAWGNRGVSLRWNRVFTPILYGEVVGAWSNFYSNFNVNFGTPDTIKMATNLTDLTLKSDLTWYETDRLTSDFGFDCRFTRTSLSFQYDTSAFGSARHTPAAGRLYRREVGDNSRQAVSEARFPAELLHERAAVRAGAAAGAEVPPGQEYGARLGGRPIHAADGDAQLNRRRALDLRHVAPGTGGPGAADRVPRHRRRGTVAEARRRDLA